MARTSIEEQVSPVNPRVHCGKRFCMSIPENIADLQTKLEQSAKRARRNSAEITLMAVTKTHPPERIREAYNVGLRLFGENRVQEFVAKASELAGLAEAHWHMIGH